MSDWVPKHVFEILFRKRHRFQGSCIYGRFQYIEEDEFCGLPIVPIESVSSKFPPNDFSAFVAIGYNKMNSVRAELCERMLDFGYTLRVTYREVYDSNG